MADKNWIWRVGTALYAVIVLFLSLAPFPASAGQGIPHFDKVLHILAYMLFAFLLYRTLRPSHLVSHPHRSAFLLAVAYGILLEFLQLALTEYRTFSAADMLANLTGALLGILICRIPFAEK